MERSRFDTIVARYPSLRIAVIGDVCLDRYLEIDPALAEISIETGLRVHNIVNVRSMPGAAGTVLNNLAALGIGTLDVVGARGDDGEGYELQRAMQHLPGVRLDGFLVSSERRTFSYTKPLVIAAGSPPVELERLDQKNHSRTPAALAARLAEATRSAGAQADAVVVLDQVDLPDTGVICPQVLAVLAEVAAARPAFPILADSRIGFGRFPPLWFKMNGAELARQLRLAAVPDPDEVARLAARLAHDNGRPVIVTLAERGMVVADPTGSTSHVTALPVRGPIDVCGAGDAVTANLAAAFAAGATLAEAAWMARTAASVVIHQLGTTGVAGVAQLRSLLPVL